jgi:phosphatidate phosphatase
LQIYLQARFVWQGSKLLRHFLQYLCFMMAMGTALSRISDYKHHWSDVLVGALQGALVAVLVVCYPFQQNSGSSFTGRTILACASSFMRAILHVSHSKATFLSSSAYRSTLVLCNTKENFSCA